MFSKPHSMNVTCIYKCIVFSHRMDGCITCVWVTVGKHPCQSAIFKKSDVFLYLRLDSSRNKEPMIFRRTLRPICHCIAYCRSGNARNKKKVISFFIILIRFCLSQFQTFYLSKYFILRQKALFKNTYYITKLSYCAILRLYYIKIRQKTILKKQNRKRIYLCKNTHNRTHCPPQKK